MSDSIRVYTVGTRSICTHTLKPSGTPRWPRLARLTKTGSAGSKVGAWPQDYWLRLQGIAHKSSSESIGTPAQDKWDRESKRMYCKGWTKRWTEYTPTATMHALTSPQCSPGDAITMMTCPQDYRTTGLLIRYTVNIRQYHSSIASLLTSALTC